jgi:uncharacterized protein YktB (UPF0637 family)
MEPLQISSIPTKSIIVKINPHFRQLRVGKYGYSIFVWLRIIGQLTMSRSTATKLKWHFPGSQEYLKESSEFLTQAGY